MFNVGIGIILIFTSIYVLLTIYNIGIGVSKSWGACIIQQGVLSGIFVGILVIVIYSCMIV